MFLTSFLALAAASAPAVPPRLNVPAQGWTIDYGDISCTLAHRLGGENSAILALNAPLANEPGELLVLDGGSGLDRRLSGDLDLSLDGGAAIEVRARRRDRNGLSGIQLTHVPEDLLDRVAGAHRLTVSKRGETVIDLDLENARQGVEALGRCNEDLLQGWGIDVAARRALQRKARINDFGWTVALHPGAETSVIFVAEVSERGRALDCRILASTGSLRMDNSVCDSVRRARFEPALDANGRPVRSQFVTRVRWTMGES